MTSSLFTLDEVRNKNRLGKSLTSQDLLSEVILSIFRNDAPTDARPQTLRHRLRYAISFKERVGLCRDRQVKL
jgi:hypothetical protein